MRIETKFEPGDHVVAIVLGQLSRRQPCATCDATGRVALRGQEFTCPSCRGRQHHEVALARWHVDDPIRDRVRVAVVLIEARTPEGAAAWRREPLTVAYQMRGPDGPSSVCGHARPEADVFADLDAARAECDRRNAALDADGVAPPVTAEEVGPRR